LCGVSSSSSVLVNTRWMKYDWSVPFTPANINSVYNNTQPIFIWNILGPNSTLAPKLANVYANTWGFGLFDDDGTPLSDVSPSPLFATFLDPTCQNVSSSNCPIKYLTYPMTWDDGSMFCSDDTIANWPADYKAMYGSNSNNCKCKDQATGLLLLLIGGLISGFGGVVGSMQRAKREWDSPYVKCPNFFAHLCPVIFNLSTIGAYSSACYKNIPDAANATYQVGFICLLLSLFSNLPCWIINFMIPAPDDDEEEVDGPKAEMNDTSAAVARI